MTSNTSPRKPGAPPRKPTHTIFFRFLVVLVAMGLLPLGTAAYKLIDLGREALVTSQQEVQLQVAASTARQLNAAIDGIRGQLSRLAEGIAVLPKATGGSEARSAAGRGLMARLLGPDLLLLRLTPRSGPPVEARQTRFASPPDLEKAITGGVQAALDGTPHVADPVRIRSGDAYPRSVLVVTVPVGADRPVAASLTGVVDFATFWDPLVGGRRSAYIMYALDSRGDLFAAQDEDRVLKGDNYKSFGVVQECRGTQGRSALTTPFSLHDETGRPL